MKKLIICASLMIVLLFGHSCKENMGGIMDYTDYQVENKLDAPIALQMIYTDKLYPDIFVTIPSNSIKTIVFSINAGGGYSLSGLKSIIVTYNNNILKDTIAEGNSLLNYDAYTVLAASTYKKKVRHNLRFTIDSTYVKEHLK